MNMSEWYTAKNSDIDIDIENKEFNILVKANESGNVYLTLSFDLISAMHVHFDQSWNED